MLSGGGQTRWQDSYNELPLQLLSKLLRLEALLSNPGAEPQATPGVRFGTVK